MENTTKVIPFRSHYNRNDDICYEFLFHGKEKQYEVYLTIDELNDSKLIKGECNCLGYITKKTLCKHLKESISLLREHNIELWGENELFTKATDSKEPKE